MLRARQPEGLSSPPCPRVYIPPPLSPSLTSEPGRRSRTGGGRTPLPPNTALEEILERSKMEGDLGLGGGWYMKAWQWWQGVRVGGPGGWGTGSHCVSTMSTDSLPQQGNPLAPGREKEVRAGELQGETNLGRSGTLGRWYCSSYPLRPSLSLVSAHSPPPLPSCPLLPPLSSVSSPALHICSPLPALEFAFPSTLPNPSSCSPRTDANRLHCCFLRAASPGNGLGTFCALSHRFNTKNDKKFICPRSLS